MQYKMLSLKEIYIRSFDDDDNERKIFISGIVASTLLLGACDLNIHLPGGNNDSSEDKQKLRRVIIKQNA